MGGRGRNFQELDHHPLFDLFWLASEQVGVSFSMLMYYSITVSIYEAQGLVEVRSSAILDTVGSSQSLSRPWAMSVF